MTRGEPIEVVSTNQWAVLFGAATPIAVFLGVFGAVFVGRTVADVLGVAPVVANVAAGAATAVALVALPVVAKTGQEARFYEDRVEVTGGILGVLGGSTDYDDVDIVLRKSRVGDKVARTATFELVCYRTPNTTISYATDPDAVERALDGGVTTPREQLRRVRDGRDRSHFWDHWPHDEEPPEDPVVDQDELGEILDVDLGDVDMDALDEARGLDDFDDLGDLGDVASDIGDAGGDGGGDGGGGGGE